MRSSSVGAAPTPRRSCLVVPGSSPKMLAKAAGVDADELVLDLEDAVVPAEKEAARALVVEALASEPLDGRAVAVRVNGPWTSWCHADLIALATAPRPPATIVLPKVECAGDLAFAERLIDGAQRTVRRASPIRLQA